MGYYSILTIFAKSLCIGKCKNLYRQFAFLFSSVSDSRLKKVDEVKICTKETGCFWDAPEKSEVLLQYYWLLTSTLSFGVNVAYLCYYYTPKLWLYLELKHSKLKKDFKVNTNFQKFFFNEIKHSWNHLQTQNWLTDCSRLKDEVRPV